MIKKIASKIIILGFGIYFLLPLTMTVVYVFSEEWARSILPKGLTLQWFVQVLEDPRFITALGHSLLLAFLTCFIILVIMIPSITIIFFYFPKLDRFLQIFSLLPFAIPAVILATGLLNTYSGMQGAMLWVLIGALFIASFPVVYQSVKNSLLSLHAKVLIEAAETLGASHFYIFTRILLPNIQLTMKLSGLLVFSSIFGEFVLTNLLIGGKFETIRIYMLLKMNANGHLASAVMVIYFVTIVFVALLLNHFGSIINFFRFARHKLERKG